MVSMNFEVFPKSNPNHQQKQQKKRSHLSMASWDGGGRTHDLQYFKLAPSQLGHIPNKLILNAFELQYLKYIEGCFIISLKCVETFWISNELPKHKSQLNIILTKF